MKIITSVAGGGKTIKMIELAIQHIEEDKTVHIMSGEVSKDGIASLVHGKELSLNAAEQIKFTSLSRSADIFEVVSEDDSDVILLDGLEMCFTNENPFVGMDWGYVLKELKKIEQRKDIEIYVTIQANRGNKLARTPIVSEYITKTGGGDS